MVVIIIFNRIDAPVAVVVLSSLCCTDEASWTSVNRVFDAVLVIIVVFEVVMTSIAVMVEGRCLIAPVFLSHRARVVHVEHGVIVIIVIGVFVHAPICVVIVP